jgi:hypothetical protein
MKKRIFLFVSIFVLVFGLGTGAWAISYTGSITESDGLFGTDGWSNALLNWAVDDVTNTGSWTYDYTFTVVRKGISHVITEVSDNFTADNIMDGTTAGWELQTYNGQGGSNPGIPGELYGLKWGTPETDNGDVLTYSWTIVTDRAPMWGDFYAKDGTDVQGTIDVYAYNTGFGIDTAAGVGNGNAYEESTGYGWVLVPDTTTQVPEPITLLLLGLGLVGLAGIRKR